jgi:hypothetical protein
MSRQAWLVALGLILAPLAARAEVYGFKINSIEGLNGVDLDDRFGSGPADEEHLVNYRDCLGYLGIEEGGSTAEAEVSEAELAEVVEDAEIVEVVDAITPNDTTTDIAATDGEVLDDAEDAQLDDAEEVEVEELDTEEVDAEEIDAEEVDTEEVDAEEVDAEEEVIEHEPAGDEELERFVGAADEDAIRKIEIDWTVNDNQLSGTWWYSIRIGSCSESSKVDDPETDSCVYLRQKTELVPYSSHTITVTMEDLLGTECSLGDVGETRLFFTIQSDFNVEENATQTVNIEYDYEAPNAVTGVEVSEGENNVTVNWSDEENSETVSYKVYWNDASFDEGDLASISSKDELTATSYQVTDLELEKKYWFCVVALDEFDNESELSELISATPVEVTDGFEFYKEAGGEDAGGFCFVATATYGSVLHPSVAVLRDFRDHTLMTGPVGRTLVHLYYLHSPPLAEIIRHQTWLRWPARVALAPVTGAAWVVNQLGLAGATLAFFAALGAARLVRSRRRAS